MINDFIVLEEENNLRVDKLLFLRNSDYSRSFFDGYFKDGKIFVNEIKVKPSFKVTSGDRVYFEFKEEVKMNLAPLDLKLNVIYEDDDILVISKERGLVVHPGNGHKDDTLLNALINAKKSLSDINGENRLGIVHRLDKDTSGLLLICKNNKTHIYIASKLKNHEIERQYIGIVSGVIREDEGKIIAPIGRDIKNRVRMAVNLKNGKEAVTYFKVLKRLKNHTLVEFKLETGRTHQIRVHMAYINFPLEGDSLYNDKASSKFEGQLLHAYHLKYFDERKNKEFEFNTDIPQYLKDAIKELS